MGPRQMSRLTLQHDWHPESRESDLTDLDLVPSWFWLFSGIATIQLVLPTVERPGDLPGSQDNRINETVR
jgi:hypothetical protein